MEKNNSLINLPPTPTTPFKVIYQKLLIKNWGLFYDENVFEFSIDRFKNITYIIGGSGKGKTTIFNALKYVLFQEVPTFFHDQNIVNKRVIQNNKKKIEMELAINFQVIGNGNKVISYKISRSWVIDNSGSNATNELERREIFKGEKLIEGTRHIITPNEFEQEINVIYPQILRRIFFIDGENFMNLFSSNNWIRNLEIFIQSSDVFDNIQGNLQNYLQEKIFLLIRRFLPELSKIKIEANWEIRFILNDNRAINFYELGFGKSQFFRFCFIFSLISSLNIQIPVVIQEAFQRSSRNLQLSLANVILSETKDTQLIIIVNPLTHKQIIRNIQNRIGKSYDLDKGLNINDEEE